MLFIYYEQRGDTLKSMLTLSLGIGAKLGAILMLPGYLFVVVCREGPLCGIAVLFGLVFFQIIIGLPFLIANSNSYFKYGFD